MFTFEGTQCNIVACCFLPNDLTVVFICCDKRFDTVTTRGTHTWPQKEPHMDQRNFSVSPETEKKTWALFLKNIPNSEALALEHSRVHES